MNIFEYMSNKTDKSRAVRVPTANKVHKVRQAFLNKEELSYKDVFERYGATKASFYHAMADLREKGYEFEKTRDYKQKRFNYKIKDTK